MDKNKSSQWADLLAQAVNTPGMISEGYSAFHQYSSGNQSLAYSECMLRGIPVSPIATYKQWQEKGRQVRKGEKAIGLYLPVTIKKQDESTGEETIKKFFLLKNNWFALSQTEGEDYIPPEIPDFSIDQSLSTLGIRRVEFDSLNGNCQGFAKCGVPEIAINPLAVMPEKTTFHEMAHHILGHTNTGAGIFSDGETTPKNIQEVEAESVAYICLESLGLTGGEYCRGYIQSWLSGETIPDQSARRIFSAADKILKAGKI